MQKLNIFFGKLLWGLLLFLVLNSISSILHAEGTQQVAPNDSDDGKPPVMLIIENDDFGDFGTESGSRLYFTIKESGEVIHLGLSEPYNDDGTKRNGDYFVRIYRDGFSSPVANFTIQNGSSGTNANVQTYDESAFEVYGQNSDNFSYTATEPGDYWIEFELSVVSPSVPKDFFIGFWDFTVTGIDDTVIPGRVWSTNWAFRTPPVLETLEQETCGWNRPFDGTLYSYTDITNTNGFVSKIDFDSSGFIGLSFNVAFNSTGPGETGTLAEQRKSLLGVNETTNAAEYRIFLNEPDPVVFPSDPSLCGDISVSNDLGCQGDGLYCIDVTVTQPGQVEFILDFNADGILTPNAQDTSYIEVFAEAGTRCLEFPGLYRNGDPIEFGDNFTLVFTYSQGVQHYAAYDVEFLENGFCVETIRPICNPETSLLNQATRFLYWDDRNIVESDPINDWDTFNPPKDGRNGYICDGDTLRKWNTFSLGAQICDTVTAGINNNLTSGYGDKNTLNTWWFANLDTATVANLILLDCMIGGADGICSDILYAEVAGSSPPYTFSWSGPNGFTSTDSLITVTLAGEYSLTVTDATGCTTSCNGTVSGLSGISCNIDGPETICVGDVATYTATVTGGAAPFTYSWTGPGGFTSTEETVEVSEAGEYCAIITDANGCTTECCQSLSFFADLSCTVDGPATICVGDVATYTATVTGGTAPFTYSWTGPDGFTSTEESIEATQAGEYCAIVTDANGCTTECCQTLSFVTEISCTIEGPEMICVGETATYTATATTGAEPFTYNWTGPGGFTSTEQSITISEAGEYCAIVTDANGCETECCQTLSFFPDLSCEVEGPTMICVGDVATYTATVTGGAAPFTYSWTGPGGFTSTEETVEVSEAGEYCAIITDANGCTTECCQSLSFFADLSCTVDGPATICVGDVATYTATVTGGTAPFTYSWTGPDGFTSTEESIEATQAGEYCAIVTDANGCTTECCQTLSFVTEISCTIEGPEMICVGETATYTATATTGAEPFTYNWTGPGGFTSTEQSITISEAGEYCAIVTDANGCETECCQTLSFFPDLSCEVEGPTMICVGDVATYTATVTGGAAPFTYSWTGPGGFTSTEETVEVSEAGEYCAIITDANGCTTECCQSLSFFADLSCTVDGPATICVGDVATYTATVTGGTAPFTYSWTGPDGFVSTEESIEATQAGEYCAIVTDANGCTTECCQTLSFVTEISCTIEGPEMICVGETATYTATATTGAEPFTYNWTGPGGFTSTEQSITISEAGEYCAIVTDANGCETECCQTLSFFPDLSCEVEGPTMICVGDVATYTATVTGGAAPFTYSWTGPGGFTSTEETVEVSEAGEYCAIITDANGCTTECCQSLSFFADLSCTVDGPATICVGDVATYTATVTGGTAPFTYSWTGPDGFVSTEESIEATQAGEYCAIVTDANGCTTECCQTLSFVTEISCTIEGPEMICVGETATYTATATTGAEPFTYNWTGPGGFTSTEQSITISEAGEYCAIVTDANGCETECCQTLSFFPDLSCEVEGPTMICVGDVATYTATVTGGAAPFTYSWTGPGGFTSTEETVEVSEAGEYCAIITDANGCTTECCQSLSFFADLSCTVDGPATICVGDVATYTATVTGGTAPFTYSWTGPDGFVSTEESIEATQAGEYCAIVTDANGCTTECCQTLSFVTEISCTIEGPEMICVGETATYTATATTGAEPFTYNWTGPGGFTSTEQSITISEAGEYCAIVTDANGCETECCQTLSFFPDLSCEVEGPTMICVGDVATYTATVTGGTAPFTYSWTGPGGFTSTEETVEVSEAGEYCAIITDANGCTTECCQSLSFFADLSCTVDGPATICVGDVATYTATVTGGTAPFTYSWTGPDGFTSTEESIEATQAGEYCAIVTDANGCTTECCQTLSFVTEISCTIEGPEMICVGETATYTATATTGAEPFTYNWTGPGGFTSTEQSITISEAGEYCAIVTDANGCETECCQTLSFFPDLSCEVEGPTMICVGDVATYTATVTGGAAPFTYSWTGPGGFTSTEETVEVSEAGEYCAIITDANGCTTECCQSLSFFADLSCTVDGPATICVGDVATYTATVTGGTAPFTYSWTGPDGFVSTEESIEATQAGEYCAIVTDANGCTTECCQTLSFATEISCTIEGPEMICVGETATYTTTVTGGAAPFTYSWTGPNGFMSTDESVEVSEAGEYCAIITDANGCTTECCQSLSFFADLSCEIEGPENPICQGETATFTATVTGGTAPFTYSWMGPNGFTATEASVTVSEAGAYTATVTDANGCTTQCSRLLEVINISVDLTADQTEVIIGGSVTLTANTMGCDNCTYVWTGPNGPIDEDGPVITVIPDVPLQPNNEYVYTVVVSEGGLCPAEASITITVLTFCDPEHIYIPNAFTPNGDNLNDNLGVISNSLEVFQDMELLIYNRWGEEMFRTTNPMDSWDGTYRNEPLPPDVYGFYLRVVCPSGEELIQKGNITLLR